MKSIGITLLVLFALFIIVMLWSCLKVASDCDDTSEKLAGSLFTRKEH